MAVTCCNANCDQGRKCPTRQACELAETSEEPDFTVIPLRWRIAAVLAVIAATFAARAFWCAWC